jgi:diguanylate cyclase (GGDEF)-like protein
VTVDQHTEIARRTQTGRLAGVLFIVGGLASVPANLLFDRPPVGALNHVLVVVAIISGTGCLLAKWDRVPDWIFHLVPITAAVEVAVTVWAVGRHGPVYEWFFVLVAVFTAYAFDSRRVVAAHMTFCTLCAALPLLYRDDTVEQVARIGVMMPMLWVATTAVTYLREGWAERQRSLSDLARRDPLTGVGNRRVLSERLPYEIARHRRTERQLALLVLDLDGFKEVNDRLGHTAGDQLLAEVAQALIATVRTGDTVIRHGGDEFCILAPETDAEHAQGLAARIREALAGVSGVEVPVSASIGAAVFPADGATAEELLATADIAERSAKSSRQRQLAFAAS